MTKTAIQTPYESGITLVELIIVIVLLGILAAVGSTMISDSITTTRMVNADTASTTQARYVIERLAREIREVKYINNGGSTSYCVTTPFSSTSFVFKKPTSGSTETTSCTSEVNTVTMTLSSGTLTMSYTSPASSGTLSTQVSNASGTPLFAYYQSDGTSTATTASSVYFVVITLEITDSTSGQAYKQRTRVALRNTA